MKTKLAFLLAALFVVAACGGPSSAAGPSPDDAVTGAPASYDNTKSRPELREPEEGLEGVRPRTFDRHRAEGRKVTLFYYSGLDECYGLDHIGIREGRHRVVLTIFEGYHPETEACPDIAVEVRSIATLKRPLGNRKVVDGAR